MVAPAYPNRFEVWLVNLDPSVGSEIAKTRPCVVASPDAANKFLRTVLVAPLTHIQKRYPTRVDCQFLQQPGQVALDQIRAVDTARLVKRLGQLEEATSRAICGVLGKCLRGNLIAEYCCDEENRINAAGLPAAGVANHGASAGKSRAG